MITPGDIRDMWFDDFSIRSVGRDYEEECETFEFLSNGGKNFSFTLNCDDTAEDLVDKLTDFIDEFDPKEHAASLFTGKCRLDSFDFLVEDARSIKEHLDKACHAATRMLMEEEDEEESAARPTAEDEAICRKIAVGIEKICALYTELSEPFRQGIEEEFGPGDGLGFLLHKLSITADDVINICDEITSKTYTVTNIVWDTDGEDVDLPDKVTVPEGMDEDAVADWLSDTYGFLVKSYSLT